jgi:hypothetical protein
MQAYKMRPVPSVAWQPGCANADAMAKSFLMLQGAQCSV